MVVEGVETLAKGGRRGASRRTSSDPTKEPCSRSSRTTCSEDSTLAEARREARPGARLQRPEAASNLAPLGRGRVQGGAGCTPTPTPRARSSRSSARTRWRSPTEVGKLGSWAGGEAIGRARGRAARRARARGRSLGADRRVGRRATRRHSSRRASSRFENNDEPFLLAVSLASHVGRVRAAQALAEEGLGVAGRSPSRLKIKDFPARKALAARGALLARRARRRARPPRRPGRRDQGRVEALRRSSSWCAHSIDVTRGRPSSRSRRARLFATSRAAWAFLRAAVFLWIAPRAAARSIQRWSAVCSAASLVLVAGLDRSLEPTRDRLHGRAVAEVLAAIHGGRAHALLLLLDVRHPKKGPQRCGLGRWYQRLLAHKRHAPVTHVCAFRN